MILSPGAFTVKLVLRIFYYNIYNYRIQKHAGKKGAGYFFCTFKLCRGLIHQAHLLKEKVACPFFYRKYC